MALPSDVLDRLHHATRAETVTLVTVMIVLYLCSLAIYRLYLSPIASFPGPKLAALTQWVETYYELVVGDGGQFPFEYHKWHAKYGPIIRINPWELHIEDSGFYETLYAATKPVDKVKALSDRFGNPRAAFSTVEHHIHRQRRAPMNPFFSKRKISGRSHLIQKHVDELCERLVTEYSNTGKILRCKDMFGCLAADVIVDYCFERRYNCIHAPDFQAPLVIASANIVEPVHWFTQFPLVQKVLTCLPDSVVGYMNSDLKSVNEMNKALTQQCLETINFTKANSDAEQPETIFRSLLLSDLPSSEKTLERLHDEAISLVIAGLESVARAFNVALFHIINNPSVHQRLQQELADAIPDPANMLSWEALQQLPWLTACIEEGLRLTYGSSQRIPRIDHQPIVYRNHVIPPETIVSMDTWPVLHDEAIFPDSFSYKPERWLDNPKAPDGRNLIRYQVSFARGTRACLGTQLGYAELFLGIASLIRRLDFEPYEFDITDVQFHRDRFAVRGPKSSKGVRVIVK